MTEPVPPRNVRAVLEDGREIPLDCLYVGVEDGIHTWEVVNAPRAEMTSIRVAALPGRTQIRVSSPRPVLKYLDGPTRTYWQYENAEHSQAVPCRAEPSLGAWERFKAAVVRRIIGGDRRGEQ